MIKYAYIYEVYRHVNHFVGPFDTWEEMMKSIEWMVMDDDNVGDNIQDSLLSNFDDDDELIEYNLKLRIFEVSEKEFNKDEILKLWHDKFTKEHAKWKKECERQHEEREKSEYKRLKKKYEE